MSPAPESFADHWMLDPSVAYLNHGAFGACPRVVLDHQRALRDRLEIQPTSFLARDLEGLLDDARAAVAEFVGAEPVGIAFVANATTGVNTVLRSLTLAPGDELLATDHAYNACANALRYTAARAGASVVGANVPFPIQSPSEVTEALCAACTPRTRLLLVDHVTSPTGLVFPLAEIVAAMQSRGVDVLVDGAHAPGMLPLDLRSLGAAYYTGNLHKWGCAPKGSAFLYTRADRRSALRPLVISHGAENPRTDRTRYLMEADWVGTIDPTPYLSAPVALGYIASLLPGGWPAWMARNRDLALEARRVLCNALGVPLPAPDAMIGSIAAVPIPDGSALPLQERLLASHGIEVPIMPWPRAPSRLVRISAQGYNHRGQYVRLADALQSSGCA